MMEILFVLIVGAAALFFLLGVMEWIAQQIMPDDWEWWD